jgi:hypothetical protein
MRAARRALAAAPVRATYAQRMKLAAAFVKSAPPSWKKRRKNRNRRRERTTKKQQTRRNGDPDVKPRYGKQMRRAPSRVIRLKFRILHPDP